MLIEGRSPVKCAANSRGLRGDSIRLRPLDPTGADAPKTGIRVPF